MATILLIDDDPCFRALVSTVIAGCGHKLIEVSSAKSAQPFLAEGGLELVILDGLLPDADGAAWLKTQRSQGMTLPVLFVSAFRKSAKDQQRIKEECGAEDFLAKPTTAPALLAEVERMLQKSAPAAELLAVLRPEDLLILQEMERDYALTLPGFIAGLKTALEQLRANPRDTGLQGVARRRAHQIAGTAGSFGFALIGDACAAIEDSVALLQAGSGVNFAPVAKALAVLCATPALAA
jgi:DNA-binding response OmpR family regulator